MNVRSSKMFPAMTLDWLSIGCTIVVKIIIISAPTLQMNQVVGMTPLSSSRNAMGSRPTVARRAQQPTLLKRGLFVYAQANRAANSIQPFPTAMPHTQAGSTNGEELK